MKATMGCLHQNSQGGQVCYPLDFHPGGSGTTPTQGNQQAKKIKPPSVP